MKYADDLKIAREHYRHNKAFLKQQKRLKPKDLDGRFHQLHEETFQEIDCLECANCCKTTSPLFLPQDIERLAKALKMKVAVFEEAYLRIDEEGDYVLKHPPCPFLGSDNKCIVYDSRPKACREYPHTNRKRMYQITGITLENTMICPAVSRILKKLQEKTA